MKKIPTVFAVAVASLLLAGFDESDFPVLPHLQSMIEWTELADTTAKPSEREWWISERREYASNGQLLKRLSLKENGDTVDLRTTLLNADSLPVKEMWYNTRLFRWLDGDTLLYKKYTTRMRITARGYTTLDSCDRKGHILQSICTAPDGRKLSMEEYTYDSTGMITQDVKYVYKEGSVEMILYGYIYERDDSRQVLKRNTFFLPQRKGTLPLTALPEAIEKKGILIQTVYFNKKGEWVRRIEYNILTGAPALVYRYRYEYYE